MKQMFTSSFPLFWEHMMREVTWLNLPSGRENIPHLGIARPITLFGFGYSPLSSGSFGSSRTRGHMCTRDWTKYLHSHGT